MRITRNDDVLRQSRLARLRLQSEGDLPGGVLREEIDASWRRSLGHGLDCLEVAHLLDAREIGRAHV